MALRELVAKLGFQIDSKALNQFERSIDRVHLKFKSFSDSLNSTRQIVTGISAAIGIGATAMTALSVSVANSIKESNQLAAQLGLNVDTLREFENAAQSTGVKVNDLSNSFSKFSKYVGVAKLSAAGTTKELRDLGVNIRGGNGSFKDMPTLYSEVSRKILNLKDSTRQAAFAQKIFGTTSLDIVRFMGQSSDALAKQREEVRALTFEVGSDGVKASYSFIKAWSEFKTIIDNVKNEIGLQLMPYLTKMFNKFKEWFKLNKDIIKLRLAQTVAVVTGAFRILYGVLQAIVTIFKVLLYPINAVINFFGDLGTAIRVLGAALALLLLPSIGSLASGLIAAVPIVLRLTAGFWALTASMLANPITWITAAVAALGVAIGVLLDDLYHFAQGNESLIGKVLAKWLGFEVTFNGIVDSVTGYFTDRFQALGDWFYNFFGGILNTIKGVKKEINKNDLTAQSDAQTIANYKNSANRNIKTINLAQREKLIKDDIVANNSPATANISPILTPSPSNISSASRNVNNKITQNITSNIEVNVPAGTTLEQAKVINDQIETKIQDMFSFNMVKGIDSLSGY